MGGFVGLKKETFERFVGFMGLKKETFERFVGFVGLKILRKRNISRVCGVCGTPSSKKETFKRFVGFVGLKKETFERFVGFVGLTTPTNLLNVSFLLLGVPQPM